MREVVKAAALCVFPSPVCHVSVLQASTPRFHTFCAADRSVNFSTQSRKQFYSFFFFFCLTCSLRCIGKVNLSGTPQPVLCLIIHKFSCGRLQKRYWKSSSFSNRSSLKGQFVIRTVSKGGKCNILLTDTLMTLHRLLNKCPFITRLLLKQ